MEKGKQQSKLVQEQKNQINADSDITEVNCPQYQKQVKKNTSSEEM